ncbi:MAG: hypothetical protein ACRDYU_18095 [Actinomycetes bacterium]
MTAVRALLVLAGAAAIGYGMLHLLDDPGGLAHVAPWYVLPVLVHDVLLAPAAAVVGWLGARLLPARVRGVLGVGLLTVGALTALTLVAVLRPSPRPTTLLDRDYVTGYAVAVAAVAAGVLLGLTVGAGRRRRARDG